MTKVSELKCEVCGRGTDTGITLHRVNPKGEKGVWRCEKHLNAAGRANIDPVVKVLERSSRK